MDVVWVGVDSGGLTRAGAISLSYAERCGEPADVDHVIVAEHLAERDAACHGEGVWSGVASCERLGADAERDATSFERVGAKNSDTLCDLYIFMDQPAEAVTSDNLAIVLDRVGKGSQRGGLAQGAMRAMLIEVGLVGGQHAS